MKILLSCHRAELGGIQTWMVGLARSYRARGHECELFFFQRGSFEAHLPAGVPAHFGDLAAYLRLIQANRYDIVHACNMDWDYGIAAVHQLEARLVLTCHGWVCPCWNSANCDVLVACSRWNANEQSAVSDLPVGVVYNGIDTVALAPSQRPIGGPPIVAWVGRGGALEQKRIDRLAAIAPHLVAARVRVRIADPEGPTRVPPEVAEVLRPIAEFWGPVAPAEMGDFFRQVADSGGCLLSTSTFEGLPLAPIEAQACGCPVIGPDVRGVNEAVDPGHGGVVHAPDLPAGDVARLVLATLADPEAMRARRTACRNFAVQRFAHERMVDEYLGVYAQTLARPRKTRRLQPTARLFKALVRCRKRAYIEAHWSAANAQFEASERLAASGAVGTARAAVVSSLRTCPTLFVRRRRLSHLLATWWGARGRAPAPI